MVDAPAFDQGLRARLGSPCCRIISIDGEGGAGKTTLAGQLAWAVGAGSYDLDCNLQQKQGMFIAAIDWSSTRAMVGAALAQHGKVIISGVCMGLALEQLSLTSDFRIYVDLRHSPNEADGLVVDYEEGIVDEFPLMGLDKEVAEYHRAFRPRWNADLVWLRYRELE